MNKKKEKIKKTKFYNKITSFRTFFLLIPILLIIIGLSITKSTLIDSLDNLEIVKSLIGWTFAFFTLSISIYSFILKLTKSSTISRHIQKNVDIIYTIGIFITIYIIEIILFILFKMLSIKIGNLAALFISIIPLICLIILNLGWIIFPTLNITTSLKSINFVKESISKINSQYDSKLKNERKRKKKETKRAHNQNIIPKIISFQKIDEEMEREILLSQIFNSLSLDYRDLNIDIFNIMIEELLSSFSPKPEIFEVLGKISVPRYLDDDYVKDNLISKIELFFEHYPLKGLYFLYFLKGFIIETVRGPNFDKKTANSIEKTFRLFNKIGYKKFDKKVNTNLLDQTNSMLLEIAKILAEKLKSGINYTNSIIKMIKEIGTIFSLNINYYNSTYRSQLNNITELIKLEIPWKLKISIFTSFKMIMNKIEEIGNDEIHIFSIFQQIIPEIFQNKNLVNPKYDSSKIEDGDIKVGEDGIKIINFEKIDFYFEYNQELQNFGHDIIKFLFLQYSKYIKKHVDTIHQINFKSNYLSQMNRVLIDFVYHLLTLESEPNFNADKFRKKLIEKIIKKSTEEGEMLILKNEKKYGYQFFLAPLLIIGEMLLQSSSNTMYFSVFKKFSRSEFENSYFFGICALAENMEIDLKIEDFIPEFKDNLNSFKKRYFLEKYNPDQDEYYSEGIDFIDKRVEIRPGSWEIVGIQISGHILKISSLFKKGEIISKYIKKIENSNTDM